MKKLGWYALRVTVVAFVLCGGLLLAANLYVQSRSVQQRIRTALADSLKLPVSLQKTTVTPWDGVRLDGVVLHANAEGPADGDRERGPDLLSVSSFRVKFAWWPLLTQKRVVIERILLDKPLVTLREGFNPFAGIEKPLHGEMETRPAEAVEKGARPFLVKNLPYLVDQLRLRHGKFVYLNREKRPAVEVEDVNFDGAATDTQHAHGALWFARAGGPHGGVELSNYWTAVDFDSEKGIAIRDGRGGIGGGTLTTDFRLEPRENRVGFSTTAKLENAALAQLTRKGPTQPPVLEGQLHGNLDIHGFTDDPASRAGSGRFWMDGAKLGDLPLLKIIGRVLKISDLSNLAFKQAEMDYKLEGTTLHIDPLKLIANDLRIIVRGNYLTEERKLDLHGRLTIDQAISHQLPQFIESNFTPCGSEAPGSRYLDFDITGSPDNPQSNFYDRVMAGPMKNLFDNLSAPKSQNPKNPRRDASRKVTPEPTPTP